jgi:hypothetical protein
MSKTTHVIVSENIRVYNGRHPLFRRLFYVRQAGVTTNLSTCSCKRNSSPWLRRQIQPPGLPNFISYWRSSKKLRSIAVKTSDFIVPFIVSWITAALPEMLSHRKPAFSFPAVRVALFHRTESELSCWRPRQSGCSVLTFISAFGFYSLCVSAWLSAKNMQ